MLCRTTQTCHGQGAHHPWSAPTWPATMDVSKGCRRIGWHGVWWLHGSSHRDGVGTCQRSRLGMAANSPFSYEENTYSGWHETSSSAKDLSGPLRHQQSRQEQCCCDATQSREKQVTSQWITGWAFFGLSGSTSLEWPRTRLLLCGGG